MAVTPYIRIRGACENNLKNIDIDIPKHKLVVLTGISGSGKSSLAFDTIYADGQRRYMESLSSYARQFMGQMKRPDVESIEGLSPAVSISQKSTNRNPRSTVGTVTEIYDYLRLLYARIGVPHCPKCDREIKKKSVDEMVDRIMCLPKSTKIQLLAPVVRGKKGHHEKTLEQAKKSGFVRARIDGRQQDLEDEIALDKNTKHDIEIIIDRLIIKEGIETRLADSIENAFKLSDGLVLIDVIGGETLTLSEKFACPDCGVSIEVVEPRSFSFNNPSGACPDCYGIGYKMEFDEDLGIIKSVEQHYKETASEITKAEYESFMKIIPCRSCNGQRLRKEALAVTIADKNIFEVTDLPVKDMYRFLKQIELTDFQRTIGNEILKEIQARLLFLINVGLDYLSLSRSAGTLM